MTEGVDAHCLVKSSPPRRPPPVVDLVHNKLPHQFQPSAPITRHIHRLPLHPTNQESNIMSERNLDDPPPIPPSPPPPSEGGWHLLMKMKKVGFSLVARSPDPPIPLTSPGYLQHMGKGYEYRESLNGPRPDDTWSTVPTALRSSPTNTPSHHPRSVAPVSHPNLSFLTAA
jgi:hypothetical protein